MKRATRLTVFALVALAAFLLWSTMQAQRVACTVCVAFNKGNNCAHATAATAKDAERSAQTTACGTLVRGMDQAIACDNTPPVQVHCTN